MHSATIRGFTPAAPLKANGRGERLAEDQDYPRVHTRGPIEGLLSSARFSCQSGYPRVHTRGPIEG